MFTVHTGQELREKNTGSVIQESLNSDKFSHTIAGQLLVSNTTTNTMLPIPYNSATTTVMATD